MAWFHEAERLSTVIFQYTHGSPHDDCRIIRDFPITAGTFDSLLTRFIGATLDQ